MSALAYRPGWRARQRSRGSWGLGVAATGSSRMRRRVASTGEQLRARDLEVLGWVCEQYGARTDQLEVLLGSGPRSVQRVLVRLREAGLVETRRVLVGESAWVVPTRMGLRAAGQGFGIWRLRLGSLMHVAAVNDVRLHITERSPESEWVSERVLSKERRAGEHLVDAVVITGDGQRVAIEVELTVKSAQRVRSILDELSGRYDAVLYFCAPGPHRQLTGFAQSGRWRKLGVRELPRPKAGVQ
jgi:DNA-binding transcriptional ArsR family regulator